MTQNGYNQSNMDQNGPRWLKTVQSGPDGWK